MYINIIGAGRTKKLVEKAKKNVKKENYNSKQNEDIEEGRIWKRDKFKSQIVNKGPPPGAPVEDAKTSKYFYEIPSMYLNQCLLISGQS